MPDALTLPEPPYLAKTVREALEDKAALNNAPRIILGLLAGVYIGFGGIFALIALADAEAMPYGIGQTLAGLVLSSALSWWLWREPNCSPAIH